MQTAVVRVMGVAMWLIRLPDIGNQTVRSKPVIDSSKFLVRLLIHGRAKNLWVNKVVDVQAWQECKTLGVSSVALCAVNCLGILIA